MLTSLTIHQFHETRRMEIMKLFKKALLATAIFGAVGVNAAVLSSDALKLSAEGIAAGNVAEDQEFAVDFVVKKLTPSASVITLTFDDAVSLADLESKVGSNTVSIENKPAEGTGTVEVTSGTPLLTFSYGTGSFTFDRLVVDADAGTITFEVNLGNPVTAESAFRLTASEDAGVDFSGASTISYASEESDGTAIETGSGILAKTTSQFAFKVTTPFDGKIERSEQFDFVSGGGDVSANAGTDAILRSDTLKYTLENFVTLGAALAVTQYDVVLEGNFDNGVDSSADDVITKDMFSGESVATTAITSVLSANSKALTFVVKDVSLDDATKVKAATEDAEYKTSLVFETSNAGTTDVIIPQTGDIKAKVMVNSSFYIASDVDAGEWALDATVINIPYFPVGFEGLDSSVHFANESGNDVDVIITAIDTKGKKYSSKKLEDLAANSVTKVSQTKLMSLLGVPAGSKLSVTFNIDAVDGAVNAYAFSNAGTGRQALVTSQQNGK